MFSSPIILFVQRVSKLSIIDIPRDYPGEDEFGMNKGNGKGNLNALMIL